MSADVARGRGPTAPRHRRQPRRGTAGRRGGKPLLWGNRKGGRTGFPDVRFSGGTAKSGRPVLWGRFYGGTAFPVEPLLWAPVFLETLRGGNPVLWGHRKGGGTAFLDVRFCGGTEKVAAPIFTMSGFVGAPQTWGTRLSGGTAFMVQPAFWGHRFSGGTALAGGRFSGGTVFPGGWRWWSTDRSGLGREAGLSVGGIEGSEGVTGPWAAIRKTGCTTLLETRFYGDGWAGVLSVAIGSSGRLGLCFGARGCLDMGLLQRRRFQPSRREIAHPERPRPRAAGRLDEARTTRRRSRWVVWGVAQG